MSEPLKIGDLVMVVRWLPCGCGLGMTGIVSRLWTSNATFGQCWKCKAKFTPTRPMKAVTVSDAFDVDSSWLKRINPPEHGDSLPTRREMKEKV